MAFFAIMLPDALKSGGPIEKALTDSFVGLPEAEIRKKQDELKKIQSIIRDEVVKAAVTSGTAIPALPATPVTPASAPAPAAVVSTPPPSKPKKKFNERKDVEIEWVATKAKKRAKEEGGTFGFGKKSKRPTGKSLDEADKTVKTYLDGIEDFSMKEDDEIEARLLEAAETIEFVDKALKKTGSSRHRTPRRSKKHSTYKRNMKH